MINMENVGDLDITESLGKYIMQLYYNNNENGVTDFNLSNLDIDLKQHNKNLYTEKGYKQMALDVIKIS